MLISEAYREQNQQLHESEEAYGTKGHHYAKRILHYCAAAETQDVLDYGCGKQTLQKRLPFPIKHYDPCIPGLDTPPEPADILVCTDVLEHIEPDCLDSVLDDIRRLTRVCAFLTVDTRPARKFLPDGRNAHLIQEPAEWWFPKLYSRFEVVQISKIVLRAKDSQEGREKNLGFIAVCS